MGSKGMHLAEDLTGRKFNRLTVLYRSEVRRKADGHVLWVCRCDCGKVTAPISGRNLRYDQTRSCGCLKADANRRSRKQTVSRQCVLCGAAFTGMVWSRYCSKRCAWRAHRLRKGMCKPSRTVVCSLCGREFLASSPRAKYCSIRCRDGTYYRERNQAAFGLHVGLLEEAVHGKK